MTAHGCATIAFDDPEVRAEAACRAPGGDAAADRRGSRRPAPDEGAGADDAERRGPRRRSPAAHALPALPRRAGALHGVLRALLRAQPVPRSRAVEGDRSEERRVGKEGRSWLVDEG